ncbi:MAG: hypothetical protein ABI462_03525 [Ignavibacteria bacterium]
MINVQVIVLIVLLFCIAGCEEDNVLINERNVTGQIYDEQGFPVDRQIISVNSAPPYYVTNVTGKFSFDNVSMPFDINFSWNWLYKDITRSDVKLNYPYKSFSTYYSAEVNISIPKIESSNEYGVIAFLTNDNILGGQIVVSGKTTNYVMEFYLLQNTVVHGKMIYLTHQVNGNGNIIAYKNFGEKEFNVSVGNGNTLTFTNEDINLDPSESEITVEVNSPDNIFSSSTTVSLNFPGYTNQKIYLSGRYTYSSNYTFNTKVPLKLTIPYNCEVLNNTSIRITDTTNIDDSEKLIYLDPGESGLIQYPPRPKLILPANNEQYVDKNYVFTFGSENDNCVYEIEFGSSGKGYNFFTIATVFTESRTLRFGELMKNGFRFENNKEYLWRIKKMPGFKTMNDYVSSTIPENVNYKYVIASEVKRFTTGIVN